MFELKDHGFVERACGDVEYSVDRMPKALVARGPKHEAVLCLVVGKLTVSGYDVLVQ
jgi:hypothetical protein